MLTNVCSIACTVVFYPNMSFVIISKKCFNNLLSVYMPVHKQGSIHLSLNGNHCCLTAKRFWVILCSYFLFLGSVWFPTGALFCEIVIIALTCLLVFLLCGCKTNTDANVIAGYWITTVHCDRYEATLRTCFFETISFILEI